MNGYGSTSEEVVYLIDTLELHDLPLQGLSFTFSGRGHTYARSRLDRFIVSDGGKNWFSNINQKTILWFISYHVPVRVSSGDFSGGPRPFKFLMFGVVTRSLGMWSLIIR